MEYVGFEEFIQAMKKASEWKLEKTKEGLTLLITDEYETVRYLHSPNPVESTDVDWGTFAWRIGTVIDMQGVIPAPLQFDRKL